VKKFLLCTDLDRTLIPNGSLPLSPGAIERFKQLVSLKEATLTYVTGRHRTLIEQAISNFDLPQPDFVIADVGTTIYRINESEWQHWDEWDSEIAPDWRGLSHNDISSLLKDFPTLRLQEAEKQNLHKLSFYIPLKTNVSRLIGDINTKLKQSDIKANLIWSIDEEAQIGLLDVLPISANKLHAIRFLMNKQGYTHENTIFSGDSGNDLDVLLSDIPAILVANADAEVRKNVADANKATLYIAKGGFLGMNGNYSAGIIEGVAHYLPEIDAWLREQNQAK